MILHNYLFVLVRIPFDIQIDFSLYIELLQSIEEKASNYYSLLQGLEKEILKDVKKLKTCKQQRIKKFNDRVSGIQKDVETSVTEVRFFPPKFYGILSPSHLKKLHSILRIRLEKLNCGFLH